jgi:hypothetical protein
MFYESPQDGGEGRGRSGGHPIKVRRGEAAACPAPARKPATHQTRNPTTAQQKQQNDTESNFTNPAGPGDHGCRQEGCRTPHKQGNHFRKKAAGEQRRPPPPIGRPTQPTPKQSAGSPEQFHSRKQAVPGHSADTLVWSLHESREHQRTRLVAQRHPPINPKLHTQLAAHGLFAEGRPPPLPNPSACQHHTSTQHL